MDLSTIYSKTGKGLTEVKSGCKGLAREHARVLMMVDGAKSMGDILNTGLFSLERMERTFYALLEMGLVKVYVAANAMPEVDEWDLPGDEGDDFPEVLPVLEVEEFTAQESVQAWAQARKGATELKQTGFFSYGNKSTPEHGAGKKSLTALVVEDDEDIADLLKNLLAEKGFTVTVASDMRSALIEIAQGVPPDVVLLDIVLPGMPGKDGFDVLAFIHRKPEWSAVPVVMVTSQVSDEQVMKGLKTNADAYIFKPFKWETLYACIKNVVGI